MWKKILKQFNSPDSIISMILGLAVIVVLGSTIINAVKSVTTQRKIEEQKKAEEKAQQIALPATHTVVEGDTLWAISIGYYKTGYNWVDIASDNKLENPDIIYPEQKLIIPDVEPRIVEEGQVSSTSTERPIHTSYTVIEGDNLWDISVSEYNNGYKWPDVAGANSIPNPDLIYPGTILQLP